MKDFNGGDGDRAYYSFKVAMPEDLDAVEYSSEDLGIIEVDGGDFGVAVFDLSRVGVDAEVAWSNKICSQLGLYCESV